MIVGIIGFGGMGTFHSQNLQQIDGAKLKGVYDINNEQLKKAQSLGFNTYDSREEILADKEIELIIIATPNNFHKEIAIAALNADKHVICEKPVMMNASELIEVMAVAKETGKLFTVHQNRRWDKDFNIVKKVINDNMIGKPFYIESRVQGSRGIPGDWRCEKIAGGGMMLDWGVHLIDQIMWLVDSPVSEVYAHLLNVKFDCDDNFKVILKFKNGISALIEVDTYTFINLPRWHISADEGTMVINDWDCNGEIKKANLIEFKWEQGIVYTSAGPTKTMAPRPLETIDQLELPDVTTDACDYYRNVFAHIQNNEDLIVTSEQALRVMKVIDACFTSSEYGVTIKCDF
jgi:scyllo-inositol 2-dehydrogenase (NADP+)